VGSDGTGVEGDTVTGSATGEVEARGPVSADNGDATLANADVVVADKTSAKDDSMFLDARSPLPISVAGRAAEAEVIAARAVWSQAPTLIPLLAALCHMAWEGFWWTASTRVCTRLLRLLALATDPSWSRPRS
jgi:hypothetical protein